MLLFRPRLVNSFHGPFHQIIRKVWDPTMTLHRNHPFPGIEITRSDPQNKPNLPWGFCIYRCTFKDNVAWSKMIQLIRQNVQKSLELCLPPGEERAELLEAHDLVIHDEPKFDGATSHEVRDHFHGWVAEQLPKVFETPETLQMMLQSHSDTDQHPGPEFGLGARFNLALFVDDICLESMDHMREPVVKIMYKPWGDLSPEERNYKIDPEWHDGTTGEWDEDVGWMYMSVGDYVDMYDRYAWTDDYIWIDEYSRPPLMNSCDKAKLPGFWRI
ncbi:hypothetical protein N7541_004807 [Penicillium brevicompactum]|uniref:Uncharacterized protein n=1 Tax=Penicillium brevicompactum TaxID=5074 RepID=A0A9W9REW6_PENBR|nr:hypothetical protein N7541_004807 [Penicillium brevicompactum]